MNLEKAYICFKSFSLAEKYINYPSILIIFILFIFSRLLVLYCLMFV